MLRAPSPGPMTKTLRVLSALLGYPDAEWRGDLPEMRDLLHAEGALSRERLRDLDALIDRLAGADGLDAESGYVELFDRGRATSLYLFEHVHGDSRDRGPAMIDLGETYAKAGLLLRDGELPDFLPAVLEFVSSQPPREATSFLGEMAHLFGAILGGLQRRDSDYAAVLVALLELADEKVQPAPPAPELPLDESWAEPIAFDGCSTQGQARPDLPQPIRVVRRTTRDDPRQGAPAP